MYLIQFGFTGIGVKKGILFNKYDHYPMYSVRFLIVTIIMLTGSSNNLFRNALSGLAQDRDWHIKNANIIRLEKRKARSKAKAQAKSDMEDLVDMYKEAYDKCNNKLIKAQSENTAMRKTIKIVGT